MLGDSTLDNIVWVKTYDNCIKYQLEQAMPDIKIINYSADGFTSQDMLSGRCPVISWSERSKCDLYPSPSSSKFKPLNYLEQLENPTYALLSVGGNDIREILRDMSQLESAVA